MDLMKSEFTLVAFLLLFFTLPCQLQAASGWTTFASVTELTPTNQHRYLVSLNISENPSGCRDKSHFYQDYSMTGADQMFQTLLQAAAFGKQIRLYVTGRCELNGYAEFSSVTIVP
jgi:hypothetical protein